MTSEGVMTAFPGRSAMAAALILSLQMAGPSASSAPPATGCSWTGPSKEELLARHSPAGVIAGTLAATILPFLQRGGIPVCLVSVGGKEERVRLALGANGTMREALSEIVRQAPRYQFRAMDGKLVIYPHGEIYDMAVDLGARRDMTRAAAYFFVLRGLRQRVSELGGLRTGIRSEGASSGKRSFGDTVEVGGSRSVIEHLVSLVQKRPSIAFNLLVDGRGAPYYEFVELHLLTALDLHLPSSVKVGESFQVELTAKLADGTTVALAGPECWVSYASSDPEALEIDDSGRAVARKKGTWTVYANYQHVPDTQAEIRVE